MNEQERAMSLYEKALLHNPYSEKALTQIASLCRSMEKYAKAIEYFQRILKLKENNGEVWGALGHCYLMLDDLHKAYSAYQQALYHLQNPKEPKLWYGIGILYDRYGSFEHAEDAFTAVIEMDPTFDKANEIYFRLGIIYKQQSKYENAMECFKYILACPPSPLTELDILFQIGQVYENQKMYPQAKDTYERILSSTPRHAKVLQQLGWLYQHPTPFQNLETAISYLNQSLDIDQQDPQSWYLLGRCYMTHKKYNDAYNAYQQAVYRDAHNPTFWCSVGVLYYQINQFSDALDAYGRALRLNPYIPEIWYDLGTLYESCENQKDDAIDAYTKALELDPNNQIIKQRIELLKNGGGGGDKLLPKQPSLQDAQLTYPSQGGSAPSNYKGSEYKPTPPGPPSQKPPAPMGHPQAPPPLGHPPGPGQQPPPYPIPSHLRKTSQDMRNPPPVRRGPVILGQQLNRAGLPDDGDRDRSSERDQEKRYK